MKTTGMQEDTEMLALHHTRLVSWAVQQFGKALLIGGGGYVVGAIVVAALQGTVVDMMFGGSAVSFFAFALYLASCNAPAPTLVEDDQTEG